TGEADELEVRQRLDQRPGKRGAFAHQADDVERRELRLRVLQRLVEDRDLDALQLPPVGILLRDLLVVIQNGELHWLVMPLSFTTLPQRAIASARYLPVASGLSASTSMPSVSVRVFCTSGSLIVFCSSKTNLSMIGLGVPVSASARILPPFTCAACAAVDAIASSTCPPMTSSDSGPPPL